MRNFSRKVKEKYITKKQHQEALAKPIQKRDNAEQANNLLYSSSQ